MDITERKRIDFELRRLTDNELVCLAIEIKTEQNNRRAALAQHAKDYRENDGWLKTLAARVEREIAKNTKGAK